MEYSKEQLNIVPWIENQFRQKKRCLKLIGHAGTGKSQTMQLIAHKYRLSGVLFCCPTHQAKEILNSKVGFLNTVITIHSGLGLAPAWNDKLGKNIFQQQNRNKINSFADKYDNGMLIIDEASMINTKILNFILRTNVKRILFVGDSAQLPPVKETNSILYSKETNYPIYSLTQNFRQKTDSIIALAECIRTGQTPDLKKINIPCIRLSNRTVAEFYEKYPYGIALCATHNLKNRCIQVARNFSSEKYLIGDKLKLETPIDPPFGLQNGEIVKIINLEKENIYQGFLGTKMLVASKENKFYDITIPNSRKEIEKEKKNNSNRYIKAKDLDEKDFLKVQSQTLDQTFTYASHSYAMTVHKSQGSTFENVLFCRKDIEKYFQTISLQLNYTAVTRAAKTITIGV